ncbi:hypothetical protein RJT34_30122 [Clitoria ternatea]|uniref:Uncharacterized protein n=1 Tax=Clitoria ternatea TaxID=43366 RepID=A0AAN9EZG9_CLITE
MSGWESAGLSASAWAALAVHQGTRLGGGRRKEGDRSPVVRAVRGAGSGSSMSGQENEKLVKVARGGKMR